MSPAESPPPERPEERRTDTPLPAERCVMCGRSHSELGGRRIVTATRRGIALVAADRPHRVYPEPMLVLEGGGDWNAVVWGMKLSEQALDRVRADATHALHPWMCLPCAGYFCSDCGGPLSYPPGADHIDDDGRYWHCAILPVVPKCLDAGCAAGGGVSE